MAVCIIGGEKLTTLKKHRPDTSHCTIMNSYFAKYRIQYIMYTFILVGIELTSEMVKENTNCVEMF